LSSKLCKNQYENKRYQLAGLLQFSCSAFYVFFVNPADRQNPVLSKGLYDSQTTLILSLGFQALLEMLTQQRIFLRLVHETEVKAVF